MSHNATPTTTETEPSFPIEESTLSKRLGTVSRLAANNHHNVCTYGHDYSAAELEELNDIFFDAGVFDEHDHILASRVGERTKGNADKLSRAATDAICNLTYFSGMNPAAAIQREITTLTNALNTSSSNPSLTVKDAVTRIQIARWILDN